MSYIVVLYALRGQSNFLATFGIEEEEGVSELHPDIETRLKVFMIYRTSTI